MDAAAPIRRAIESGIVQYDDGTIGGGMHVELERIDAERDSLTKRLQRVLGRVRRVATMTHDRATRWVEQRMRRVHEYRTARPPQQR